MEMKTYEVVIKGKRTIWAKIKQEDLEVGLRESAREMYLKDVEVEVKEIVS